MKIRLPIKTNSFISALLVVLIIWGCKQPDPHKDWSTKGSFIDSNISLISKQQVTDKREESLFIDSLVRKMKLTDEQKSHYYRYKSSYYCYYLQKGDSAILYADSVLLLLNKLSPDQYPDAFAMAYYTKGDALYASNLFNEAYTFYYKARQFKSTQTDFCTQKEYNYRLGMILYKQKKFKEAAYSFRRSLEDAELCDEGKEYASYYRKQELMNNIALSFYMLGNYDSASFYYYKALNFISKHQQQDTSSQFYDEMAKGVVYGNLGAVYRKKGNLREAENLYNTSIQINFKKGGETMDAQHSYLKLAELYQETERITDLENALKEIRLSLNKTPNPKGEIKWHKLSWKYYELTDDPNKAYYHLSKYQHLFEEEEKLTKKIYEVDINEQLEIAMGALQKTLGEKDSILKLVAHDLRTPVASIPTMVEIIMTEENEEQKKEYLEMIKSACNSSLTLMSEIMATADISSSNIEKEPTLLNEFINDCAAILDIKVKEKNQQLTVQYLDKDISVPMNPEKMKRVVFNLVTNSVKFSKRDTSIKLSLQIKDNQAIIEIKDEGIGIPEKLLPEIFNISKSGKRKGTEGEKSYGLGLNICKKIVEAHDGKISVKSEEGKGSTFTVALPLS